MPTRADVVAKAREYVGTPFQHQARVKDLGVDCVGLVLCVAEDLGLLDKDGKAIGRYDYPDYSPQPIGRRVYEACAARLVKKGPKDYRPGDVLSLRVPLEPVHVAIVTEYAGVPYMVHAYNSGSKKVVEHILNVSWQRRIAGVFQFAGIED